jgi:uncharacterized Zn finger protein
MSTNKIDEMTEREAKSLLNDICCAFGIGGKARNHSVVMTNVENSIRRSRCLDKIETIYVKNEIDDEGEEVEIQLLNWGQEPDEYEATFRKVAGV